MDTQVLAVSFFTHMQCYSAHICLTPTNLRSQYYMPWEITEALRGK